MVLGLSLRRGYEHSNHSSEKETFQATEQGGKQSVCISLPLVSELLTQSLALLYQVFLQLYWMSRAVDSQASLKKDTLF